RQNQKERLFVLSFSSFFSAKFRIILVRGKLFLPLHGKKANTSFMPSDNNPNTLGTASIGKLLIQYSIPAIIGMTIVSLYHIIDSIFIGHGVGPMAISGLAITFPLMNLAMAFCTLISSGASALASIRLGQKDLKGATDVLGNALMICLINSILLSILSYFFLDKILFYFGASEATLPY
ncbi:hypothetical protein EZS27_043805, partial [termite gut metagenome]